MDFSSLWLGVFSMFEFVLVTFVSILNSSTFWNNFLSAFAVCVVVRFLLAPIFSGHAHISISSKATSSRSNSGTRLPDPK